MRKSRVLPCNTVLAATARSSVRHATLMLRTSRPDPVYFAFAGLLAIAALGFLAMDALLHVDWLKFQPISALLSLMVAFGLFMRGRPAGRMSSLLSGSLVVVLCGLQLGVFIAMGQIPAISMLPQTAPPSFAAGLFCIGGALVLDAVLPSHWGRHLLFGLLGAVAAMIGAAGVFAMIADLSAALDAALLSGMRFPGAVILLLGGLALLTGARLRGASTIESHDPPFLGDDLHDRSGLAAALTIMLVTLGTTLVVWRQVQNQTTLQVEVNRDYALQRFAGALSSNASKAVTLLNGVRGLFAASEPVGDDDWIQFFQQLPLAEQYAGVIAVAYAARIETPELNDAGEPVVKIDGAATRIWPKSSRDVYYPTILMMPRNEATQAVLGLDLGASPAISEVIVRAGNSSLAAISGRLDFAKFRDQRSRVGFVMALPVIDYARAPNAGQSGSLGISGFVYAAMDMSIVVGNSILESRAQELAIQIVDDAPTSIGTPLFSAAEFDPEREFVSTVLPIAGRHWTIYAQVKESEAATNNSRVPFAVLAGGLFSALVLFVMTWVLTGHRARALSLAGQVNRELSKSQRAQQAVTDTASAGIISADGDGNILYMNPSAARSFGVSADAMVGKALTVLMPERFRDPHKKGIQRVSLSNSPHVIGDALEMAGLHADGREFPIEILLSAWTSDGQMYFTALVTDITDRKRVEIELQKRARELERSNADLEQFAYVASHDLQEPLRMVASYVQLLARRYRGRLDTDADEFIGFAVDGATRMQSLIDDLLAYAKVGRSGREPGPTSVKECVESATALLQGAIDNSRVRIRINADCIVLAVPAQLTQVFQNLIGNAIKFHGEGVAEIAIDAERDGAFWLVKVTDNGIGIAPQHCERVFAIFQRLHTRSEYPGTGVGLAICRKIVEGFGGRIWVESEPGVGSVFHFTLPAFEEKP